MKKYQCVADEKIYTEEQMRNLFKFKEYKGYAGTFDDWIQSELDSGYITNYIDTSLWSLEEILDYAKQHDMKYRQLYFIHEKGGLFVVIDADMGLFGVPGRNGFSLLADLEAYYENEPVFRVLQI